MSAPLSSAAAAATTTTWRFGLKWVEECLSPDDYQGYAELGKNVPRGMLVTTGEREAMRWGFRMLLEHST